MRYPEDWIAELYRTTAQIFALFTEMLWSFQRSVVAMLPILSSAIAAASVDVSWYAPNQTLVNSLASAINGSGVYGFVFNSSTIPAGVPYGSYNWCNMPHVRRQEYPSAASGYTLKYVEVIHRHHKRTPYQSNTFPVEQYDVSHMPVILIKG